MLEVKGIQNGIVLDHISAGKGLTVFNKLFANTDHSVVLLMNVTSQNLDKKDIIKIEGTTDVDLNVLGLIDSGITVNIIKEGKVSEKHNVVIPEIIQGVLECENPRCITNADIWATPTFKLVGKNGQLEYACDYCEEITKYRL